MKYFKHLIATFCFLICAINFTFAQLAPTDGQYVELNLLTNGGFENGKAGWVTTGVTSFTSSTINLQEGAKSAALVTSGSWTLSQSLTKYATGKAGQNAEVAIWVQSAATDIWLCPFMDSNVLATSTANGCMQYTGAGLPQRMVVYPQYGNSSNGIRLSGSSATTVYVDKATLKDRPLLAQGQTVKAPTAFTPTSPNGSFGSINTTSCSYSLNGMYLSAKCRFAAGSLAASPARISLPNNYTIGAQNVAGTFVVGTFKRNRGESSPLGGNVLAITGNNYIEFGAEGAGLTANPLVAQNATAIFNTSEVIFFEIYNLPIAELASTDGAFTTRCDNPLSCETVLTADFSNAGIKSNDGLGWINGNASLSNTSTFAITFTSGVFTTAPTCFYTINISGAAVVFSEVAPTSSGVTVRTLQSLSAANLAFPFTIMCRKNGADYLSARTSQQIIQSRDMLMSPGAVRTDFFTVSYGATSNTNCTSGACAYLSQPGTTVSSISASGTVYTMTTAKSYKSLWCSVNGWNGTTAMATGFINAQNVNANTFTFSTYTGATAVNSYGLLNCQATY